MRWLAVWYGLAALGLWLLAAPSRAQGDEAGELRELRDAIETHRERVVEYERQQRGLLELLEEIDRSIAALARDARRARREAEAASRRLSELEARVAELEPRLERTRRAMARRAVALYKAGELGTVQTLFAASNARDLFDRMAALRQMLEHDRRLLSRFQAQRVALARAREAARQAAARHEAARARVRARVTELGAERAAKRALLAHVRRSRARERAALVELEAAARALEETLGRLPEAQLERRELAPGPDFASQRGALPWPVEAPIARPFGRRQDGEFQTELLHKGVEFAAPAGASVRAVAAGVVRFADWFRGYGRVVILDHGDRYFTVSGHLDEIRVELGEAVARGEVIGTVGESGSLSGPMLYFELRHGVRALDPAEWLEAGGPS